MERVDAPWPGNPDVAWAASAATPPDAGRPPGPDLSSAGSFGARAVVASPHVAVPVILTVLGVIGVLVGLLAPRPDVVWTAWFWLGVAALVAAPLLYLRMRRRYPDVLRTMYGELERAGVVGFAVPTGFRVPATDGWEGTSVVVDRRVSDGQAGRLRAAFRRWLARVSVAPVDRGIVGRRVAAREVVPAEDIFGPEATGGFLVQGSVGKRRWRVLLPREGREWNVHVVKDDTRRRPAHL